MYCLDARVYNSKTLFAKKLSDKYAANTLNNKLFSYTPNEYNQTSDLS